MKESIKDLQKTLELIRLEKKEELDQYKQKIQNLPLDERVTQGYSWYQVETIKKGYTFGDRAFIIVERTSKKDLPHRFRSGMTVNFFTRQPNVKNPERAGVINFIKKDKMKIILNTKDLPDWTGIGLLGIDLLFDDRSYREMEYALSKVIEAKGDRLAELREIMLGAAPCIRNLTDIDVATTQLNESQNKALNNAYNSNDVTIIHGPPGTGKTTTIVQIVKKLSHKEQTILVTAPSNTAVDLLTERLAQEGLDVVRIGNISRADENIVPLTLDAQLAAHPEAKNIKKVKIQAAEYRRKAQKYKRSFGREQAIERKNNYAQAKELEVWANQLEKRVIDQLLEGAQVITATLVSSSNKELKNRKFRTVVIDEAAQALEPASWIPILKASKVILAGDPYQLPPTIKSREAQKNGLETTLIEKCIHNLAEANLLRTQYRMHKYIMGFSNTQFYDNQLIAAESVKNHQLDITLDKNVLFIDTAGCGFEEKINEQFKSRYNPDEFQILCEHLLSIKAQYELEQLEMPSTAIISPYREQVVTMRRAVEEDEVLSELPLVINTIDGFQGQEKDIVYISLVRSNDKTEIGFLKDYRRMNVAMTRARKLLVIVGDSATIGNDSFYGAFLDYVDKVGGYQTAWEYMA